MKLKLLIIILQFFILLSKGNAQSFEQINSLYSCRPLKMFDKGGVIYLVTPRGFYALYNDKWINKSKGLPECGLKKIEIFENILIAITYDGFYWAKLFENNIEWHKLYNDGKPIMDERILVAPDLSSVHVFSDNTAILIGNYSIVSLSYPNVGIQYCSELPFTINRECILSIDSVYIQQDGKLFYYSKKNKRVIDITKRNINFYNRKGYSNLKFQLKNRTYDFSDGANLEISSDTSLSKTYIKYPCRLSFINSVIQYKEDFLISDSKNGVFRFSPLDSSITYYCNGINEGWFTEIMVHNDTMFVSNPDGLTMYSTNRGKHWLLFPENQRNNMLNYFAYNQQIKQAKLRDTIILENRRLKRPDYSDSYVYNTDIFIEYSGLIYHSEDGYNFKMIDRNENIITMDFDGEYIYYSLKESGIYRRKFKSTMPNKP